MPVPDFPCFVSSGSFLAEYKYLRGTGQGGPVQPDSAWMPIEDVPQPVKTYAILLRKSQPEKVHGKSGTGNPAAAAPQNSPARARACLKIHS